MTIEQAAMRPTTWHIHCKLDAAVGERGSVRATISEELRVGNQVVREAKIPEIELSTFEMFPRDDFLRVSRYWATVLATLVPGLSGWKVDLRRAEANDADGSHLTRVSLSWNGVAMEVNHTGHGPIDAINGAFFGVARLLDLGGWLESRSMFAPRMPWKTFESGPLKN